MSRNQFSRAVLGVCRKHVPEVSRVSPWAPLQPHYMRGCLYFSTSYLGTNIPHERLAVQRGTLLDWCGNYVAAMPRLAAMSSSLLAGEGATCRSVTRSMEGKDIQYGQSCHLRASQDNHSLTLPSSSVGGYRVRRTPLSCRLQDRHERG